MSPAAKTAATSSNPTLTEHASQILPYRGMGSGIPRALEVWSRIDLVDDPAGNQFSAVVWRPEAEWGVTGEVTPPVTPSVEQLLVMLAEEGPLSSADLRERLQLKDRTHFREHYTAPALEQGLIEYTIPDKPNSRLQRYRLTAAGKTRVQKGME